MGIDGADMTAGGSNEVLEYVGVAALAAFCLAGVIYAIRGAMEVHKKK